MVYLKIIDDDGTIRTQGKYPVSQDGKRILVKTTGGKGPGDKLFKPLFSKQTEFREEFTRFERWILRRGNHTYHMAKRFADKCINFNSTEVPTVNADQVKEMAESKIWGRISGKAQENPILLYLPIILLVALLFLNLQMGGYINF